MITKEYSKDLTGKNTFRMQVNCRTFIEYDSVADLFELDFEEMLKPVKHIGGGSNLLFTQDFKGTILHSKVNFIEKLPHDHVSVGAGVVFDDFCAWAAQEGLWGPENLSYIPGEVGAAAVQNIGAYGVEAKDIIKTVYAFDLEEEEFVRFDVSECDYGYRESMFKHAKDRYIITHVVFALSREPKPRLDYSKALSSLKEDSQLTPGKVRDAVIAIRKEKLPEVSQLGSAGSFFKNPVVSPAQFAVLAQQYPDIPHFDAEGGVKVPAAWLIDRLGWKGKTKGGAQVYPKQPLVIVNMGAASAADIVDLAQQIMDSVVERFGIHLHPEVNYIE